MSDDENIVPFVLPFDKLRSRPVVDNDIVTALMALLAQARRGELRAIDIAYVDACDHYQRVSAGRPKEP
jgi:hypothetical protein